MKTSAIHHRVADFLKTFPPFCYLDLSEVEKIAGMGRVRFHEPDEILFSSGAPYDNQLHVIQQGTVQLTRPDKDHSQVVDLLGAGDIAGLGRFLGRTTHEHTATTLTDTVVYALDFKTFSKACTESPQATRFLQIHVAADKVDHRDGARETNRLAPTAGDLLSGLICCSPNESMQSAAALMQRERLEVLLVTDEDQKPLGCITATTFRDYVAAGVHGDETPISQCMHDAPLTVAPESSLDDCILQMARSRHPYLCITVDGTPHASALGMLTEQSLLLNRGNNPTVILRALAEDRDVAQLAEGCRRLRTFVEHGLQSFSTVEWHADLVTEANHSVLHTLLKEAEQATTAALGTRPGNYCLATVGQAGRGELVTPIGLETILVLDHSAAEHDAWYSCFAERLTSLLEACGFSTAPAGLSISKRDCRLSLDEWTRRFSDWIHSPVENDIMDKLPLFDFTPLEANHPLALALRRAIFEELVRHPNFVRLLANDCLESAPPLTILEGYAVDATGLQTEELEIHAHAVQPVVNVARVFQLGSSDPSPTSTLKRLARVADLPPEVRGIFDQAARAFRIASSCSAISGLRTGSDGARIRPATLSRADQVLLKSGFQSIANLLGYTAKAHGLQF